MPLKEEELKEEQKEAATSGRGAVVSRGETNYRGGGGGSFGRNAATWGSRWEESRGEKV